MPAPTPSQLFLASVRCALQATGLVDHRILVACSGGPDSTALLLALCSLQGELGLSLHVVYVDHGLRQAAATEAEAQAVRDLAAALDLPAEVVSISVPQGPALMAAARERRYQALAAAARRAGAHAVATGHTASDQAETLLMRLLSGAALRGLASMAPARPIPLPGAGPGIETDGGAPLLLVRPLLDLDRAQVLCFLGDSGVSPLTDPTNADRRFLRARLRADLLPLLRAERPDFERHTSDLCAQLRADASLLDDLADQALARLAAGRPQGNLPAADLAALPVPLAARVVLRTFGPLPHRLVLAVLDLCRSTEGSASIDLPDRRRAERRYGDLLLSTQPEPDDLALALALAPVLIPGPGTYTIGQTIIRLYLAPLPLPAARFDPGPGPGPGPELGTAMYLDPQAIAFPLVLRPPRPGDRIRLRGVGRRKVSDVLIDAKVPRADRPGVALLTHGDEILWVVGVRGAYTAAPAGAQVLVAERLSPGLTGRGRMQ